MRSLSVIGLAPRLGLCLVAALSLATPVQDFPAEFGRRAPNPTLPPGITLLPGFQHERYQTPDSIHGRIWTDQKLLRFANKTVLIPVYSADSVTEYES